MLPTSSLTVQPLMLMELLTTCSCYRTISRLKR
jgi:hypothetical protein